MTFDVEAVRRQFPALATEIAGAPAAFFDGPAGSQVPQRVIDAVAGALRGGCSNTHGRFELSRRLDDALAAAAGSAADLFGAGDPECVVFGANMTSLTFQLSRALAASWREGDEVIVTRLDHDANVTPWVRAARDAGARVVAIDFDPADCTLDVEAFARALTPRTRLVAVGAASNATGTINRIADIGRLAHDAGALMFVDAVHYAPHRLIDVAAWDCDFVACSAYKFFGPHVGLLWGKREHMASLPSYQVRAAGDGLPDRWSTGTGNHEGIAGTAEAIDYLVDLGGGGSDRRAALTRAYQRIEEHESALLARLLDGLDAMPAWRVWGITDRKRFAERAPTVAVTHERVVAGDVAQRLGDSGIFVWDGNYYALDVTSTLGLDPDGMVRIGILHYNTAAEVDRLLAALEAI